MTAAPFQVGQVYYGTLSCAHGSFPLRCVKRTEKSVWFEHLVHPEHYPQKRSKARPWGDGRESADFHGWLVVSDAVRDNGWDMSVA